MSRRGRRLALRCLFYDHDVTTAHRGAPVEEEETPP
jgi:hypothetical protein